MVANHSYSCRRQNCEKQLKDLKETRGSSPVMRIALKNISSNCMGSTCHWSKFDCLTTKIVNNIYNISVMILTIGSVERDIHVGDSHYDIMPARFDMLMQPLGSIHSGQLLPVTVRPLGLADFTQIPH